MPLPIIEPTTSVVALNSPRLCTICVPPPDFPASDPSSVVGIVIRVSLLLPHRASLLAVEIVSRVYSPIRGPGLRRPTRRSPLLIVLHQTLRPSSNIVTRCLHKRFRNPARENRKVPSRKACRSRGRT